jgi:hypothetical protein
MEDPQLPLDIEVRAVKNPDGYVGVGAMVCCGDTVVWEESKYVGQGLSWHVAEYGGLLDAMHAAEALGLLFLNARVSSRVVSDQVSSRLIKNSVPHLPSAAAAAAVFFFFFFFFHFLHQFLHVIGSFGFLFAEIFGCL